MRLGGTASKRVTVGGTALVAGMAAASLGLATPAFAGQLDYSCTAQALGDAPFALTLTVNGDPGTPTVDDSVSLNGFSLVGTSNDPVLEAVLTQAGVTGVTGDITTFPVTATDEDTQASEGSTDAGPLTIVATVGTDGSLSFSAPEAPVPLGGFTANVPGTMDFSNESFSAELSLTGGANGPISATVNCDTAAGTFATATVKDKPVTNPPPSTGTQGGGSDDKNPPAGGPPANHGSANTNTNNANPNTDNTTTGTQNVTSARGTLANTGAPYVVPLSASGAALVLLGAGMLAFGRRRRAEDGLTGEVATVED